MTEETVREREKRLLEATARKDRAAFRQFYDITYGQVRFFLIRKLHDENLAEDVLVETYSAVWLKAGTFRGKSRGLTWVMGIACNLAHKALRGRRNHRSLEDLAQLANGKHPVDEDFSRKQVLAKALDVLSDKHRQVLELVFFHGMTYPEAAELLKVPVNTVKSRIFYAKKSLLKIFEQMGVHADDV